MHHHHSYKIIRHIICQHQIEVEIWPSSAEVYFRDEKFVDPVNTQVRFDATVYNSKTDRVDWQVYNFLGEPGYGEIDANGVYTAPNKGSIENGTTEIVVATSAQDSLRKAYAFITLIGFGPEKKPDAKVEIYPKTVNLYYQDPVVYMDNSNTKQLFRVVVRNHANQNLHWSVLPDPPGFSPFTVTEDADNAACLVQLNYSGANLNWIDVRAELADDSHVYDVAKIIPIKYYWPPVTP